MVNLIRLCILVLAGSGFFTGAIAQDAQVIGPQSPVEQYEAPVLEPDLSQNFIDFPSLIQAPTSQDGLEVLSEVSHIIVEFVGGTDAEREGQFVSFIGRSKAQSKTPAIYDSLTQALIIHQNQALKVGDLRLIQQDVTTAYRDLGYPLMSIVVPPQEVTNGRLKIQVNEFQLSDAQILFAEGSGAYSSSAKHWSDKSAIYASMKKIMAEPILRQSSLDKEVKYLNQNPFRQVRVVFEPGQELGQSAATLQINEQKPWNLTAGYNNHATESSGEHRFTTGGTFANLPVESHQVSFNVTLGQDREEFENYSLSYRMPNRLGHTLSLSVNYSDTASSTIPGISSASTTTQYTANYSMPLLAGDSWNWSVNTSAILKQFERASLFNEVNVGGADFDSVQLAANSSFNWQQETASNQFTANLVVSFEGITGNNTDENFRQFYNSLDGEASTQHLVLGYARVQQLAPLGEFWADWNTETQVSVQIAREELAGSDNFAIGGANVFRAYQSSEVAGDDGWYITQTLNMKPWQAAELGPAGRFVKNLALSAFVEAGEGSFEDGRDDSIWDFGVGLRASFVGNLGCNMSLAVAGKETNRTDKNDIQIFVGCNYQY